MRKAMRFAMVALMAISLCACAKTKDNGEATATPAPTATPTPAIKAEQVNDPYGENKGNIKATATPAPTATPTPAPTATPTPIEEDDTTFGMMNAKLRVLDSMSKEYNSLDFDEMDELYYSLDACLITFPSLNTIEEDRFVEATTVDELMAYINENDNIWKTKDDTWVFEKHDFHHGHDFFYNISWLGKEDIHYYMVDITTLRPTHFYEINDEKLYYDESTKTLYLFPKNTSEYDIYVSLTSQATAEKIVKDAVSNRAILALNYDGDSPIEEIVFIKPFVQK